MLNTGHRTVQPLKSPFHSSVKIMGPDRWLVFPTRCHFSKLQAGLPSSLDLEETHEDSETFLARRHQQASAGVVSCLPSVLHAPEPARGTERNVGARGSPGASAQPTPPLHFTRGNGIHGLKKTRQPGAQPPQGRQPVTPPSKAAERARAKRKGEADGWRRATGRTRDGLSPSAAFGALLNKPP